MKNAIIFITIILLSLTSYSQDTGYEINVKINGLSDTTLYLGYYNGRRTYIKDTVRVDNNGNAVFKGEKKLNRGIYLIVVPVPSLSYFEVLVTDNQKFSVETNKIKFYDNIKFTNSRENELFAEYHTKMMDFQRKNLVLNDEYQKTKDKPVENKIVIDKITTLNKERLNYVNSLINEMPGSLLSSILNSLIDIQAPESPKDENGNIINPYFEYDYIKAHYFDNINFKEPGMAMTPILENKYNYYLFKLVVPSVDSMIKETNYLINKTYTEGDSLVFRYTLSSLFNFFDTTKIMGYDAVFVAIAEDWYLNGKAYWEKEDFIAKVAKRVGEITPTMIGNTAYNLQKMQSIDDKYYNLNDIKADYTVLIFWEPNCGHCKKEVPSLIQELRDTLNNLNVKVFAIYTQYDKEEWKKFIEENNLTEDGWYNIWDGPYPHSRFADYYDIYSTPVVYVLDKNKKIIGKRLSALSIKNLIQYQKEIEEYELKNKN